MNLSSVISAGHLHKHRQHSIKTPTNECDQEGSKDTNQGVSKIGIKQYTQIKFGVVGVTGVVGVKTTNKP